MFKLRKINARKTLSVYVITALLFQNFLPLAQFIDYSVFAQGNPNNNIVQTETPVSYPNETGELNSSKQIVPCILEIETNEDEKYVRFYLGYTNTGEQLEVPIGNSNKITASELTVGQPTTFLPGFNDSGYQFYTQSSYNGQGEGAQNSVNFSWVITGNELNKNKAMCNSVVVEEIVVEVDILNTLNEYCGIGNALLDDGLEVEFTNFNPDTMKVQGRYFVNNAGYPADPNAGWIDLPGGWGTLLSIDPDTYRLFLANTGDTVSGPAGWQIRVVNKTSMTVYGQDEVAYNIVNDLYSQVCGGYQPSQCIENRVWASLVSAHNQGNRKDGSDVLPGRSSPFSSLGVADWDGNVNAVNKFFSLGFGGSIVLRFDNPIELREGVDLWVHESTGGNRNTYPLERAEVAVSTNGVDFTVIGNAVSTGSGVTGLNIEIEGVRFVRLVDTTQASIHAADADGFDLDAISAYCKTTVEIQLCKEINEQNVSGWELGLAKYVETVGIDVTSSDGSNSTVNYSSGDYLLVAEGTYRYGTEAMIADAEFSYRPAGIPAGVDDWVDGDDLYLPGYLKVQVNSSNFDWGSFSNTHHYMAVVNGYGGGVMNFRVLDDNYGDNLNNGELRVSVYEIVESGVTGENGCITIESEPGDYYAFEVMKDGFSFIDFKTNGDSTEVNNQPVYVQFSDDTTYTFVNEPIVRTSSVEVCKEVDESLTPGWLMGLYSYELVGSYELNTNSFEGINTGSLESGKDYFVTVSGEWSNRGGSEPRDAFYSTSGANTGFMQPNDEYPNPSGTIYDERIIKLLMNNSQFSEYDIRNLWGDYSPSNVYATLVEGTGSSLNFRIWDYPADANHSENNSWYGDNVGFLSVSVFEITETVSEGETGENGCILFQNIPFGEYLLLEENKDGYQFVELFDHHLEATTDWFVEINEESERFIFRNEGLGGDLSVFKFIDNNSDGSYNEYADEPGEGWVINIFDEEGNLVDTQTTDEDGYAYFRGLTPGYYDVCEELVDGWYQTYPYEYSEGSGYIEEVESICHYVTVENGDNGEYYFGNAEYGNVIVTKELLDGEGNPTTSEDEFEVQLYKDDYLYDYSAQIVDTYVGNGYISDNGEDSKVATFEIKSGAYSLFEFVGSDYFALGCRILNYEPEFGLQEVYEPIVLGYVEFKISNGETIEIECTNMEKVLPQLTIEKLNETNDGATQKLVGDDVLFQIEVKANNFNYVEYLYALSEVRENGEYRCRRVIEEDKLEEEVSLLKDYNVNEVSEDPILVGDKEITCIEVVDLLPQSFDYHEGTNQVDVYDENGYYVGTLTEGVDYIVQGYTSPGQWIFNYGLNPGYSLVISYFAQILNTASTGLYMDAAFATSDQVLASAVGSNSNGAFTGSIVAVGSPSTGTVLGASVNLPSTGADGKLLSIGVIGIILGAMITTLGAINLKRRNGGKKGIGLNQKFIALALFFIGPMFFTASVYAAPSDLETRLSAPSGTNRVNNTLEFTVLDVLGRDSNINFECFVQRPSQVMFDPVAFDSGVLTISGANTQFGNSGVCLTNAGVFSEGSGDYQIKVVANKDGDVAESNIVTLAFDNIPPSNLVSYSKSRASCTFTLNFRTANDGQTDRVEIFRSQSSSFIADLSTFVVSTDVNPDSNEVYVDNIAGCNQNDYYYALRAVDASGNVSGFTTDTVVTVTPAQQIQGNSVNQVGGVGAPGGVLGEDSNGGVLGGSNGQGNTGGESDDSGDGDILGESSDNQNDEDRDEDSEGSNQQNNTAVIALAIVGVLGLFALIAGGIYLYQRRNNANIT